MALWTTKKVPIRATGDDLEEREGHFEGQAFVNLEDCPFKQEVRDEKGEVVRVECADSSGSRPCRPGDADCRLNQWMESIKAFIRQIDVNAL
jgi:hypothetical protein